MNKQHWTIRVEGKVQGVFFRAETQKKAEELRLSGYVKNEPDGSVLIEAEGPEDKLARLQAWCWDGPPAARVNNVTVEIGKLQGYSRFDVTF